jgi:hypothetical protein
MTWQGSLLDLFNTFANNGVQQNTLLQHDNHVLISGRDFEGQTVGLAGLNALCTGRRSGNVNMGRNGNSASFVGAVVTCITAGQNAGSALRPPI